MKTNHPDFKKHLDLFVLSYHMVPINDFFTLQPNANGEMQSVVAHNLLQMLVIFQMNQINFQTKIEVNKKAIFMLSAIYKNM